jgi:hypothetical protein
MSFCIPTNLGKYIYVTIVVLPLHAQCHQLVGAYCHSQYFGPTDLIVVLDIRK